ncbi:MAG: hypothetical protein AAF629_35495 [Chloroflexota bacterium]
MQVPAIFRSSVLLVPPLHRWPQPVKRALLTAATVFCAFVYLALIVGIFSFFAILFDIVKLGV